MPIKRVRKAAVASKVVGRGKVGRKRQRSYSGLKREADQVFSEWVRRRGGEYPKCITCGAVHHWKVMQAGHFVSRVHLGTRWDERNVQPQCMADNVWKRGSPAEFSVFLTREYGPSILQELVDKKRDSVKYTRSDLEDLISIYRAKLLDLERMSVLP